MERETRERLLTAIVHQSRKLHEALESRDTAGMLMHGIYQQGIQEVLEIAVGVPETKNLFRNARAVVAQERPANND
jgi:hypothetical protein